jgi:hypothetical protein
VEIVLAATMKRIALFISLALACALSAFGQSATSELAQTEVQQVQEETVEGFWSVVGYFGSKVTSELGSRLNLSKKDEEERVPTKINLKLGWMEFSRTELRKQASR